MDRSLVLVVSLFAACKTPEPERSATASAATSIASAAPSVASAAPTSSAPPLAVDGVPGNAPDPKPALEALKAALTKVKAAKPDEAVTIDAIPAVSSLLGQSRDTIESALGKPTECKEGSGAPCQAADEVYYSLYKLAKGARGGGPELVIAYDEDAFSTKVEIRGTK